MITPEDKGIPKEKWIPNPLWRKITACMPLPCADLIFERKDRSTLYGFRLIPPYRNIWSLIGGVILYGESLNHAANRIGREYGISFQDLYLVGVYPSRFRIRSTVTIALAATNATGEPIVDGKEFSKMVWSNRMPAGSGGSYRKMIMKWNEARKSRSFLDLNRLE